jgi:hypothetical protein
VGSLPLVCPLIACLSWADSPRSMFDFVISSHAGRGLPHVHWPLVQSLVCPVVTLGCLLSAWSQLYWGPWRALPGPGSWPKCNAHPLPQTDRLKGYPLPATIFFFLKICFLVIYISFKMVAFPLHSTI